MNNKKYMQGERDKIENILASIPKITDTLVCDDSYEGFKEFSLIYEDIDSVYNKLISIIPELKKINMDVPKDVLIAQLQNLLDAFENKDSLLLSDTLMFEVNETVKLCKSLYTN